MTRKEPLVFEDLRPPEIPQRSRLHALSPVGIGTPFVESLAGYISRIALSYHVATGTLVTREIIYVINNGIPRQGVDDVPGGQDAWDGVSSLSKLSEKWVRALEILTGRADFRFLTMLTWSHVLSPRRIMREVRYWCPECYQEAFEKGQDVYEQLLWLVDQVVTCPIHHKPLVATCPSCGRGQRPLARNSRPGYCGKCHAWLGLIRKCPNSSSWDLWRAEVVGQLLGFAPQLAASPLSTQIPAALRALVRACGFTTLQQFVRFLGFEHSVVCRWITGDRQPCFDHVLKICAKTGITPLQLFTHDPDLLESISTSKPIELGVPSRRLNRTRSESRRLIIKAMEEGSQVKSIAEVCKRAGVPRQYIRRCAPDLGEQLKRQRKQFILEKRERQCVELRNEVIEAIIFLRREGIKVTADRVRRRLSKSGKLRNPQLWTIFQHTLREEGIFAPSERSRRFEGIHKDAS